MLVVKIVVLQCLKDFGSGFQGLLNTEIKDFPFHYVVSTVKTFKGKNASWNNVTMAVDYVFKLQEKMGGP